MNHRIAKLQNCIIVTIAELHIDKNTELLKLLHINLHDLHNSRNFRIAKLMELLIAMCMNHRIAKFQNCIIVTIAELYVGKNT